METETQPRLSAGRALVLWIIYAIVFALFGGIGAGVPAFVFELITGVPYDDEVLYAIMFAVTGYIAYRLARHVTGW